jgi:hypothetical protein
MNTEENKSVVRNMLGTKCGQVLLTELGKS